MGTAQGVQGCLLPWPTSYFCQSYFGNAQKSCVPTPFLQGLESCSDLHRMGGASNRTGQQEGLNEPGRRDQLPISLPLDGGDWEAFSTAGQADPLARTGIYHSRLSPVQT